MTKIIIKLKIIFIILAKPEVLQFNIYAYILHIYICSLIYTIPEEIPVIFHNASNCDYHLS